MQEVAVTVENFDDGGAAEGGLVDQDRNSVLNGVRLDPVRIAEADSGPRRSGAPARRRACGAAPSPPNRVAGAVVGVRAPPAACPPYAVFHDDVNAASARLTGLCHSPPRNGRH